MARKIVAVGVDRSASRARLGGGFRDVQNERSVETVRLRGAISVDDESGFRGERRGTVDAFERKVNGEQHRALRVARTTGRLRDVRGVEAVPERGGARASEEVSSGQRRERMKTRICVSVRLSRREFHEYRQL